MGTSSKSGETPLICRFVFRWMSAQPPRAQKVFKVLPLALADMNYMLESAAKRNIIFDDLAAARANK